MSMTAVPISMRLVLAPTAASNGNGEPSWRAKWCTRKYAPSAPSASAATASSIDCRSASDADRVCDCGEGVQCPKERNPICFMETNPRTEVLPIDLRRRFYRNAIAVPRTRKNNGYNNHNVDLPLSRLGQILPACTAHRPTPCVTKQVEAYMFNRAMISQRTHRQACRADT